MKIIKQSRRRQGGGASKLMLIVILGAIGGGLYYANNKGMVSKEALVGVKGKISHIFSSDDQFTGYGVQVMATRELTQAKMVMEDFARDGYSAFVIANNRNGKTVYKVRLGPYEHKPEAQAIKDKIKRRYPRSAYLKSSFVIYKP